jgi:hypothetical protein
MEIVATEWLCVLLLALFGTLLFLRVRFPGASKRAETSVLVGAAILFFGTCSFFLSPQAAESVRQFPTATAESAR